MHLLSFFACCDRGPSFTKRGVIGPDLHHPYLEKQHLQILHIYQKVERRFGFKECDIDMLMDSYKQVTRREEKAYIDIEDLHKLFYDFEDVNVPIIAQLLEKDKFFNEGKIGKLRMTKILLFCLLYSKSDTKQKKNLKLSLIFERASRENEVHWDSEELHDLLAKLFYIPVIFMSSKC